MKPGCASTHEAIVDLAEGKPSPEGEAHLRECPSCQRKLDQLRAMILAASQPISQVPDALSAAAVAIFKPRWIPARLARKILAPLGARSDSDGFQLLLDLGDVQIRTQYNAEADSSWRVVGRVTGTGVAMRDGEAINDNAERFAFSAKRLEDTGFDFRVAEKLYRVQPASDYLKETDAFGN